MEISLDSFLLIISVLIFISLIIGKAGYKFGVPTLLLFLLIGLIAGTDVLNIIDFNSPVLAQNIGIISLNIILFSGGMDTNIKEIKPIVVPGLILATFGVLFTACITGLFIFFITKNFFTSFSFSLFEALLLGAIMSSTDSASVFSILRSKGLSLKENLRPLLELESGSNDPMAYMLTIVLLQLINSPSIDVVDVISLFLRQLCFGAISGYLLGLLAVKIINKINLSNDALYSVLLLTIMLFIYGFTSFISGNGFLAVYVGGLVIGNHRFVHKRSTMKFFDGITWLFQIIMFLSLGLLVNPSELLRLSGLGILIGLFMIVCSRPISVFLSLLPFRKFSLKSRLFVSWVGLRGAVPIIFATYPMIADVDNSRLIFNIVFFITILSLVIQGTFISPVAKLLHLDLPYKEKNKLNEFDVEFSDEIKSAMCEIIVKKQMLQNGNRIMDINIPDHTLVAMVKRNNAYFIPKGNTKLFENDIILIITDDESALKETKRILQGNE